MWAPAHWPCLGSPSKFALEGVFAVLMLMYLGGIELTYFSQSLLDDPRVRVPAFAFAWTMSSLIMLGVAHEAVGKDTWTSFAARALTPCVCAAGVGRVASSAEGPESGFIGLMSMLTIWSHFLATSSTNNLAVRLFAFVGAPIYLLTHLRLLSMGRLTPPIFWLVPADDDIRGKLRTGIWLSFTFFSLQLLACMSCKIQRAPRHLPRQHPAGASGNSLSTPMMLALAGAAVAVMYQNALAGNSSLHQSYQRPISTGRDRHFSLAGNSSLHQSIRLAISTGPDRHILAELQQLPQLPSFRWQDHAIDTATYQRDPMRVARIPGLDAEHLPQATIEHVQRMQRTALWDVLSSFLVSALLVMYRAPRTEIESQLTPISATLEEVLHFLPHGRCRPSRRLSKLVRLVWAGSGFAHAGRCRG
jgi:hypothetical protein